MYSIDNVIVASPTHSEWGTEKRNGDANAVHYYETLSFTTAKKLLGVRLVPFLSYGFTANSLVPLLRGGRKAMKEQSFLYSAFGNTRIMGAVVCPRIMIARKKYGDGAYIIPRTKEGEVFLVGTPKEYWTAVLRGTAKVFETILNKGWTTIQRYEQMNLYSPERVFMGVMQMLAETHGIKYEKRPTYYSNAKDAPIDKELLMIGNIWMTNYIDWFNREVERV